MCVCVWLSQLHVCELVLEREGVQGYVSYEEFPLDLIPLDRDVLSLEMPHFLRSCYLVISFMIYEMFVSSSVSLCVTVACLYILSALVTEA